MGAMKVPITKPYIGSEEVEAVKKVLESGWLIQGRNVEKFEEMVAEYVGTKYARACSSCTTALHMSLLALGVGKGDAVLVPAYTFVASANVVEYTGAVPVFVDIDLRTFNIDPLLPVRKQDKKFLVKAVMPVHLFGLCADMGKVMAIARRLSWGVVEDAACALGSSCPMGMAGKIGDTGNFSFHPRKCVTTGEGGMVTTNDDEIAKQVHALRDFGFTITNIERHEKSIATLSGVDILGYNYRMTDIQGTIGVEQMKKFVWILENKIKRAEIYNRELADVDWIKTPYVPKGYKHTYQSYSVLVCDSYGRMTEKKIEKWHEFRDRVMARLAENGIATRQGTHAVHMLGYYAKKYGLKPTDFMNTYAADQLSMTIPLFPQMTDEEQEYVIEQIKKCGKEG